MIIPFWIPGWGRTTGRPRVVRARWRASLLALGALHAVLGCDSTPRSTILISIDTLRADHLGCYGHERPTSPGLDALAEQGVLFEEALAPSPWTLPSHATLLTGRYPSQHGARSGDHMLLPGVPTLAAWLAGRGFETGAVVNGAFLGETFGLDRGFQHHVVVPADHSGPGAARRVTRFAMQWLEPRRGQRVFLFLHYNDVHSDYRSMTEYERRFLERTSPADGTTRQLAQIVRGEIEVTPEHADRLARLYDAGIRQLDDEIGRLLAWLGEEGWLERTVIIVTSDHGEEFLEHGSVSHGQTHYEEMLRVPLIVRGPSVPVGVRVESPVSLVDVAPTVLGLLGVPKPEQMDGVDLAPYWTTSGPFDTRSLFSEAGVADGVHLRAIRRGRHKLIVDLETGERELYDLVADPGELNDREALDGDTVDSLMAELEGYRDMEREPQLREALDPAVQDRLRALGYAF